MWKKACKARILAHNEAIKLIYSKHGNVLQHYPHLTRKAEEAFQVEPSQFRELLKTSKAAWSQKKNKNLDFALSLLSNNMDDPVLLLEEPLNF